MKCLPIAHQHFQLPPASGRPLNTHPGLESAEVDMAELEIDKEDVHNIKECYKEKVQPYWKTDYKLIIYIMNIRIHGSNRSGKSQRFFFSLKVRDPELGQGI